MTETTMPERATYGNWIAARSPGLFGAGLLGTAVLFATLIAALLTLLATDAGTALGVAVVGLVGFVLTGTPAGAWITRRGLYAHGTLRDEHRSRSGVIDTAKGARHRTRLPGLLAKTDLLNGTSFAGSFAVLKSGGTYTIVARCWAEGPGMQDQGRIDRWVAGYAAVLTACGQETGLLCAKAITDTAPDPGGHLYSMVSALRAPGGPSLARDVMDQCAADLPGADSDNSTYLELTYRGRALSRKTSDTAILTELGRKVPGVLAMLEGAGGGSVEMVTADDLSRIVRVAYDPVTAEALEAAELAGEPAPVEWEDAGPVADRDLWGEYVHDSGRSITWEMYGVPRSKITERAMSGLLSPHGDFARKRVALIYRPHTADESVHVAERDSDTANFLAKPGRRRATASAELVRQAAEQSRQEVAAGAASVRFSVLVTATVRYDGDVAQAVSTLPAKGRTVPIRLRRCYGAQAAAFAATLPVGFVPHLHTAVPSSVREWT
jgi:hypothetical protein